MNAYRQQLFDYVQKKYKVTPEYPWMRYPSYAVFRHADQDKWFGLVMDVPRRKLGLEGEERVDILNVKMSDPFWADVLTQQPGYLWGYHISRGSWVSILLDGTVSFEEICQRLEESFLATASKQKRQELRPPKEWIIPANPKYYDVEQAFEGTDTIEWKQGSGIKKGDTVFIYMGAPVSAIAYKCQVTATDIPYTYTDENLTIRKVMKIKLLKRYRPDAFPFNVLKEEFGIYAVRGPRGVPEGLSEALKG